MRPDINYGDIVGPVSSDSLKSISYSSLELQRSLWSSSSGLLANQSFVANVRPSPLEGYSPQMSRAFKSIPSNPLVKWVVISKKTFKPFPTPFPSCEWGFLGGPSPLLEALVLLMGGCNDPQDVCSYQGIGTGRFVVRTLKRRFLSTRSIKPRPRSLTLWWVIFLGRFTFFQQSVKMHRLPIQIKEHLDKITSKPHKG